MQKTLLGLVKPIIVALLAGGLVFGILRYIQNNAETNERLQTFESEEKVRRDVIRSIRKAPRGVEESLEYLRNRN